MYKILISGYYGFNNIGDESILRTVIDNLREKLEDIDITVLSDYPGLQVYTGNGLRVTNGKAGRSYGPFAGIALEPQMLPDSPHHPNFPSTLLRPGVPYRHRVSYVFNCFSVDAEPEY